jgi:hypothetical protein
VYLSRFVPCRCVYGAPASQRNHGTAFADPRAWKIHPRPTSIGSSRFLSIHSSSLLPLLSCRSQMQLVSEQRITHSNLDDWTLWIFLSATKEPILLLPLPVALGRHRRVGIEGHPTASQSAVYDSFERIKFYWALRCVADETPKTLIQLQCTQYLSLSITHLLHPNHFLRRRIASYSAEAETIHSFSRLPSAGSRPQYMVYE